MENVYVLAGIPSIARAMFAAAAEELRRGAAIRAASVDVWLREGDFADTLERIAFAHPQVEVGSYPFAREGRFGANLVVRGTDEALVRKVLDEITQEMEALGGEPQKRV
jgi:molybdopterin-biosynthesis enzyme MoeA-like protein